MWALRIYNYGYNVVVSVMHHCLFYRVFLFSESLCDHFCENVLLIHIYFNKDNWFKGLEVNLTRGRRQSSIWFLYFPGLDRYEERKCVHGKILFPDLFLCPIIYFCFPFFIFAVTSFVTCVLPSFFIYSFLWCALSSFLLSVLCDLYPFLLYFHSFFVQLSFLVYSWRNIKHYLTMCYLQLGISVRLDLRGVCWPE